jgi:antitoxin component of RelBE/YafQ-DinJ toxin-antitoxin module
MENKKDNPNWETLAAMKELKDGKGIRFNSVKDLMADLNE